MHALRTQYPVGQGFFHAGALFSPTPFHYVYDCGARDAYWDEMSAAIQDHVSSIDPGSRTKPKLDLLVISHAHYDHLSGVPALLDRTECQVAMLPLLSMADRVLAFAEALLSEATLADSADELFIDPVEYLRNRGVEWIIEVDPTFGPQEFPGDDRTPLDDDTGFRIQGPSRPSPSRPGDRNSLVIGPASHLAVDAAKWVLVPYVDPAVAERQKEFLKALRHITKDPAVDDDARIAIKWLRQIAATPEGRRQLKAAYREAGLANINVTSLSLYSGPDDPDTTALAAAVVGKVDLPAELLRLQPPFRFYPWWCWFDGTRLTASWEGACGWLGTGDADLLAESRRSAFVTHFTRWLPAVSTFAAPHHGSRRNMDDELLQAPGFRPRLAVVGANPVSDYHHPDAVVCETFVKHHIPLLIVDDKQDTRLQEVIEV